MEPCGYTYSRRRSGTTYPEIRPEDQCELMKATDKYDEYECQHEGEHFCVPRADKAQDFFEELLVHTKGKKYARKKFILADWQRDEIIRPLFGTTVWSDENECYKRQYEIAWIELARKNGKTEILAGIMLYLLIADGEESGEIYGVARDINQAKLAFDVAAQMVKFSPVLSKHLKITEYKKRIYHPKTNSFYQVIAADAKSALGSNPSGVGADEILAWNSGDMWDSLRTGMGSDARLQPLMVASTTAGNDTEGFAGLKHKEMERVLEERDKPEHRHIFVYMRNTPMDADPWDEKNWPLANPALGSFLRWEDMRRQAAEARLNPIAEMAFRQYKLNQWQNSTVRWMNMQLWDGNCEPGQANRDIVFQNATAALNHFAGRECWFGLDLASKMDLCSMCYLFPSPDGSVDVLWRHWLPEEAVDRLDRLNKGRFSTEFFRSGWLTVTEGNVLDFQTFYADIVADSKRFEILGGDVDIFASDAVVQEIEARCYVRDTFAYTNDFRNMSPGMKKIFELVTEGKFRHHGNPLARFCFDACEAKINRDDPDLIKPVKPDRGIAAKRIDAVPAAIMAVNAWMGRGHQLTSIYATEDVFSVSL